MLLVLGLLTRVAGFAASVILAGMLLATGYRFDALPNPVFAFIGVALLTLLTGGGGMSLDASFFGKSASHQ